MDNYDENIKNTNEKIKNNDSIQNENVNDDIEKKEIFDDLSDKELRNPNKNFLEPSKQNKRKKFLIIFSILICCIIMVFGVYTCINRLNSKVYKNIYLLGINIGGKSQEEILEILKSMTEEDNKNNVLPIEIINKKINENKVDIYQDKEKIYTIAPNDIKFNINVNKTLDKVMAYGRNGNIFIDNLNIFKALVKKYEIKPEYVYDDDKLEEIYKNIELTLKNRFVDDKYSLDEKNNKLVITKGKTGNTIDIKEEKNKYINFIISNIEENKDVDNILKLNVITKKPHDVNIDEMYNKIKKAPKDAYVDKSKNPIKFIKEEVGYDINKDEITNILKKQENMIEGKVIEIPINIIKPKIKLADLTYEMYKDKLSGYTTYFNALQLERANNLSIALKYLNGRIVMPGQIFSFNKAIGDTTIAKGYRPAATFKGGKVVQEVGGGICQSASTLYNVALMANLEIIERHQHGLPVGYVPPSRDATVYSPNLDFKFKNTRNYPIKIVTSFSDTGSMNISIMGTKEEEEYEVFLSHKYLSTVPFSTKYVYDENMNEGTQEIIVKGVNGYRSESYITKKLNGKIVSSNILTRDKYNAQQQVIKIGTKKIEITETEKIEQEENN